jgi:hypothetical protein
MSYGNVHVIFSQQPSQWKGGRDYPVNRPEADDRLLQPEVVGVYSSYFASPLAGDLFGDAEIVFLKEAHCSEETVNKHGMTPMYLGA